MLKNFFNRKNNKRILIGAAFLLSFWIPFITLPALGFYGLYLLAKADKKNKEEQGKKKMLATVENLLERPKEIIQESISIISKTEKVETAIGRFDTIRSIAKTIYTMAPPNHAIKMSMDFSPLLQNQNNKNVPASITLSVSIIPVSQEIITEQDEIIRTIEQVKEVWLLNFFTREIQKELDKAGMITEPKLKKKIFNKALNISLKASEYLPGKHEEIKKFISIIEKETV